MCVFRSDPDWRTGWLDTMAEPLDRYSRVNDRLLDGCEGAFTAISDEFHSEAPDWTALVDSGALEPALAAMLEESHAKWIAAGRLPTVDVGRVNAQVLLVDGTQPDIAGFVATVVFRSRERRSWTPLTAAASTAADGSAADADGTSTSAAGGAAGDAVGEGGAEAAPAADSAGGAAPDGEADADTATAEAVGENAGDNAASAGGVDEALYEDHIQLWTFTAEHPNLGPYLGWLRSTISHAEPGQEGDAFRTFDEEPPVRWTLRDINFTVGEYTPPAGPQEPAEAVNELLQRAMLTTLLFVTLVYSMYKIGSREASRAAQRSQPPFGGAIGRRGAGAADTSGGVAGAASFAGSGGGDGGGGGGGGGGGSFGVGVGGPPSAASGRSSAKGGLPSTNQWGDVLTTRAPSDDGARE